MFEKVPRNIKINPISGKEKNREKNLPFQQQTEVMIYSFFAAFVEPRKKKKLRKLLLTRLKRHCGDFSLTLASLNADFVDFVEVT